MFVEVGVDLFAPTTVHVYHTLIEVVLLGQNVTLLFNQIFPFFVLTMQLPSSFLFLSVTSFCCSLLLFFLLSVEISLLTLVDFLTYVSKEGLLAPLVTLLHIVDGLVGQVLS